jgi:cobalt-zinc-cadmium efflux system membrane fusion protein
MLLCGFLILPLTSWSAEEKITKGSHNGRLLEEGKFKIELAIFEKGTPPEFRVWAYNSDELIDPKDWKVTVQLTRLGEQAESFNFSPQKEFYRSEKVVEEPHSFDVKVTATYKNKSYQWQFPSYEGRVTLSPAMAAQAGVTTAKAEAGIIQQQTLLYGRVTSQNNSQRQVRARFPGVVKSVAVTVGQKVSAGELLATVEGNDSLRIYSIQSPISGTVAEQNISVGEITSDQILFTIQNLDQLQLELSVFPQQSRTIRTGQMVVLDDKTQIPIDSIVPASIVPSSIVPASSVTPVSIARAKLDNSNRQWLLNSVIKAKAVTQVTPVKLRVDNRALQNFRDWQVVFIKIGNNYEIRPVTLGVSDDGYTEVLEGLKPNAEYVVENSYLLKADLEKSGASHDH